MRQRTEDQKKRIAEELEKRGAVLPCPRCNKSQFQLLDGYFNQTLSSETGTLVLGGATVPSVVILCTNCGYLIQHALGALGLLRSGKEDQGND